MHNARPALIQESYGLTFEGFFEGQHVATVSASRLVIERKRMGALRFGLGKVARIENGSFKIFGQFQDQGTEAVHGPGKVQPSSFIFKGLFSETALGGLPIRGKEDFMVQPITIEMFHGNDRVSFLSANRAFFDVEQKRIRFQGNAYVHSGDRVLVAEELVFNPETGHLRTNGAYRLTDLHGSQSGPPLDTDIQLLNTDILLSQRMVFDLGLDS